MGEQARVPARSDPMHHMSEISRTVEQCAASPDGMFLYNLTNEKGEFSILQRSISSISNDRRLQLLFIAFSLGAFFEGAAGFGTPVAVSAAMTAPILCLPVAPFSKPSCASGRASGCASPIAVCARAYFPR